MIVVTNGDTLFSNNRIILMVVVCDNLTMTCLSMTT